MSNLFVWDYILIKQTYNNLLSVCCSSRFVSLDASEACKSGDIIADGQKGGAQKVLSHLPEAVQWSRLKVLEISMNEERGCVTRPWRISYRVYPSRPLNSQAHVFLTTVYMSILFFVSCCALMPCQPDHCNS